MTWHDRKKFTNIHPSMIETIDQKIDKDKNVVRGHRQIINVIGMMKYTIYTQNKEKVCLCLCSTCIDKLLVYVKNVYC